MLGREPFRPGAFGFSAHKHNTDMPGGLQRGLDHGV